MDNSLSDLFWQAIAFCAEYSELSGQLRRGRMYFLGLNRQSARY